jgi:hypothetical protein
MPAKISWYDIAAIHQRLLYDKLIRELDEKEIGEKQMPAKSQAQRGYLAEHFGPDWMKEHHFDNPGKLPEHVSDKNQKAAPKTKSDKASRK